ncbi:hypothetical protein [Sphingopyxis sp. LK2115]|uniref:hypothetical protein n=1 Tax=Sphingopyxis sp. LK2115 TaxID=2744558 RepID=UPI0016605F28|nr:hypothetical protein [Sphingopyxis sp. LK2115]
MAEARSALAIGAAGGLGAVLAETLAADGRHDVIHCPARSASPALAIDITDADSVAAASATTEPAAGSATAPSKAAFNQIVRSLAIAESGAIPTP